MGGKLDILLQHPIMTPSAQTGNNKLRLTSVTKGKDGSVMEKKQVLRPQYFAENSMNPSMQTTADSRMYGTLGLGGRSSKFQTNHRRN